MQRQCPHLQGARRANGGGALLPVRYIWRPIPRRVAITFESLSQRLSTSVNRLHGRGRLTAVMGTANSESNLAQPSPAVVMLAAQECCWWDAPASLMPTAIAATALIPCVYSFWIYRRLDRDV